MSSEQIAALKNTAMAWALPLAGKAVGVLVVFWLALRVSDWGARLVEGALERAKVEVTLSKFAGTLTRALIQVLAALGCLGAFGIETTSFAAVLGAAGFAVGLAFQGTLSNFSAGVMILVFRPFKVGDVVSVGGVTGKVAEVELFTTQIDTPDKRRFIVPNSSAFGSTIENVTYHPVRRVQVDVGVEYPADVDTTRAVLEKAVKSVEKVLEDPPPAVLLMGLGASSVDWAVRAWATNEDFFAVKEAILRAVKMHLDEAGIGIPYTTLDVHLVGDADGKPVAVRVDR